jgi:hypothetical protein
MCGHVVAQKLFALLMLFSREIRDEAIPQQHKRSVVFTSSCFHEAQHQDILFTSEGLYNQS